MQRAAAKHLIAIAAIGLAVAGAAAKEAVPCAEPLEAVVAFSAPDAEDVLRLSVMSHACAAGGWIEIEIFSASGETLYLDGWPHSNFYDWANERPTPIDDVMRMISPEVGPMPDFPSAAEIAADPDLVEGDFIVVAPPETFDRARETGGAVACYLTSPVEAYCAWFDPEAREAVKLYYFAG